MGELGYGARGGEGGRSGKINSNYFDDRDLVFSERQTGVSTMLAARTGAAGSQISEENPRLRKQSGFSIGGRDKSPKKASENVTDSSLSPSGQSLVRARQLALLREMEMNWYLKLCDLSTELTTAYTTGMPHR